MKIVIETIPHKQQRYPTCGDWIWNYEMQELTIYVSDMDNPTYEMLVGVHEVVEALLCIHDGVSQKAIDAFDIDFEKRNTERSGDNEPGDAPDAPYRMQHCFATAVERMLCAALGESWSQYDKAVYSLDYTLWDGKVCDERQSQTENITEGRAAEADTCSS